MLITPPNLSPVVMWGILILEALLIVGLFWSVVRLRQLQETIESDKTDWLESFAQYRQELKAFKRKSHQIKCPSLSSILMTTFPKSSPWYGVVQLCLKSI